MTPTETALDRLVQAGFGGPHDCAIVTGTGLGRLVEPIERRSSLPYRDIPGFPALGVSGHGGTLHRGWLAGRKVLVLEGRAHAYENGDAAAMRVPIEAMRGLGARSLLLTCSAGSLDPQVGPESLVAISDHINLSGMNPLIGMEGDSRFVPMVHAYDPALRTTLRDAAGASGLAPREGVYAWFCGPSFETPAEIRMAARLGADLVGMSTVPEVLLARHAGLPVAALALVTNLAAGIEGGDPHHAETKAVAAHGAPDLIRLVTAFVERLPEPGSPIRP